MSILLTEAAAAQALATAVPGEEAGNDREAADIVVTATKRGEPLREVAGSISAVTESQLQGLNAQSLSDYITRIPGVVFNDYQPGVSEVVIRGIASSTYHEANQTTTGYYINQIPLVEPGFPLVIPDIDSFDVSQVEVLRGPQGTLFGSASLGGAINYVVNEADPTKTDAGFEGTVGATRRAGEASYAAKAMVNIPLVNDKLAVRVVALQRYDAGYLNNVGTGEDGSDDLRVRGLRGSLVFTPVEGTRLAALSLYQEYDLDDQTYALFGLPRFQRDTNVNEFQDTSIFLNSLRLDQEIGFATLTAIGSHTEKKSNLAFDYSIFPPGGPDPRTGTPLLGRGRGKSKSDYAELRLAGTPAGRFGWILGANYTKLRTNTNDFLFIDGIGKYIDANPASFGRQPSSVIAPDDQIERTLNTIRVRELALFGELNYTFANVLTLTAGGRLFQYKSNPRLQFLPNAALIPTFDYEPGSRKDTGFIPKLSIRYQPNNRFMAYALYSQGFRLGGINTYAAAFPTLPIGFASDKTRNYEVGTRFDLVPRTMSIDVTAFHIDWSNIQARLFTPAFQGYTVNGGGADVDGVELSLTFRPTRWLSFANSVAYTDGRLSEPLPFSSAPGDAYAKGTRLPGSSDWTISNQLQVDLREQALHPRFGIAHRYASKAPVAFSNGPVLQRGGYSIVDLNAAIDVAPGLELGAFVKNLFDVYGVVSAPFSFAGSVQRPRTVGASVRFALR